MLTFINAESTPTYPAQAVIDATDQEALATAAAGSGWVDGEAPTVNTTTPAGLAVDVSSAVLVVAGTPVTVAAYPTLAISTPSTHDRRDIIVANVSGYSVVAGTPCSVAGWTFGSGQRPPVKPPIPTGHFLVAEIYVPGGASTITVANIVDKSALVLAESTATIRTLTILGDVIRMSCRAAPTDPTVIEAIGTGPTGIKYSYVGTVATTAAVDGVETLIHALTQAVRLRIIIGGVLINSIGNEGSTSTNAGFLIGFGTRTFSILSPTGGTPGAAFYNGSPLVMRDPTGVQERTIPSLGTPFFPCVHSTPVTDVTMVVTFDPPSLVAGTYTISIGPTATYVNASTTPPVTGNMTVISGPVTVLPATDVPNPAPLVLPIPAGFWAQITVTGTVTIGKIQVY
jgi:hypothetical protein